MRQNEAEQGAQIVGELNIPIQKTTVKMVGNVIERFGLLGVWLLIILVFGLLSPGSFLTGSNFATMFGSQAVLVVLTLGLLIPMTAGDYDLSVAGTLTLSSMLVAILNVQMHVPIALAVIAALVIGGLVGFLNGLFVILFNIDPFIVTLGSGTILSGVVLLMSNSLTISGISPELVNYVVVNKFLGIPLEFYYGLLLTILLWYLWEFTYIGRRVLFVGRSRNVSRLSGIKVDRVRWSCLVASSVVSAFAGVLYAGTTGSADPTSGLSYLLPAFAAAFLGSTTINPGRFNPWGSFISVYFLVTGIIGLAILGVETYIQNLFYGGALILAVTFSQLMRKKA